MTIITKELLKIKLSELKELFEDGILKQLDYENEKKTLMTIWRQGTNINIDTPQKHQKPAITVEDKALYAQHLQLNQISTRAQFVKDETRTIEQTNIEHSNQLENMEKELAQMSSMIGLDLSNADLSNVENIVELTDEEIMAIEKKIKIPPLEIIEFKDWDSYSAEVDLFLKNQNVNLEDDPIFAMFSLTEIKGVLQDYKDNYGEISLNPKDYGIVFLAGATGALINQFAPIKLKKNKFISGTAGKQIFDESLQDWKVFAKGQISQTIGFNIDELQDVKQFIAKEISSKMGVDIASLKHVEEYIRGKITSKKTFSLLKDSIEIYHLLPEKFKATTNEWSTQNMGCTIDELDGIQKFITAKIKTKKIKLPDDSIELLDRLPATWQEFLKQAMSEKAGFDITITKDIQDFLIEKARQQKFDLFEDGLEIFRRLPEDWQELIYNRIEDKIGFDIWILQDIQEFLITKVKEKKFNLLEDTLELIQKLPDDWKHHINKKIAEKTGVNEKWIANGWNIAKLNNIRSNPADFISVQIQTFLDEHPQVAALSKYIDINKLSEIIIAVLNVMKVVYSNNSAGNNKELGESFQKLLLSITATVNSSKKRLIQIGGKKIMDKLADFKITSGVFQIDDWIKNSGLNITINDLLNKINSENIDEQFSNEDIAAIGQLFSLTIKKLTDNEEFANKVESLFASTPVVESFLHDRDSISKFTTLLSYATDSKTDLNEEHFNHLASNLIMDVSKKLDIIPEMMFDSGTEILSNASALGDWLSDNGISFYHLKKVGLSAGIIEVMVRGWYLASIYNTTKTFKKEPFAVKVSTMLASAHLFSNLPALMQALDGIPPKKLDFASLGMSAKYGLTAFTEYAKREKQIEQDIDDKLTSLYRNSLTLI